MPFCKHCGKEIGQDSKFCSHCGASQTQSYQTKERVEVVQKGSSIESSIVGAIALIVILGGGLFFAATVEIFDCPVCNNSPILRWACTYCGHDGKVTLIQLITRIVQVSIYPITIAFVPIR